MKLEDDQDDNFKKIQKHEDDNVQPPDNTTKATFFIII